MPTFNLEISADDGSTIMGAAASLDENWITLDEDFAGSVEIASGTYWLSWLVVGVSGTKFTVTAWTTDEANPVCVEKRTVKVGNTQHQGFTGVTL